MKIALASFQYHWPSGAVFSFYEARATVPVDVVYLGESVCSRRHELHLLDWLDIAVRLQDVDKEVVLFTQVLLESSAKVGTMHKIAANGDFLVEANDMGAVQRLAGKSAFVAGPHLNICNLPSLQWMALLGASRWVMPLEMKKTDLAVLQQGRHGGLLLKTREAEQFLVINCTQTQSSRVYNLDDWLGEMRAVGVDVVGLSPQAQHTTGIVGLFDAARIPGPGCNGCCTGRRSRLAQAHAAGTVAVP